MPNGIMRPAEAWQGRGATTSIVDPDAVPGNIRSTGIPMVDDRLWQLRVFAEPALNSGLDQNGWLDRLRVRQGDLTSYLERASHSHSDPDPRQLAELKGRVAVVKEAFQVVKAGLGGQPREVATLLKAANKMLAQMVRRGDVISIADTSVPKGATIDSTREALAAQQAERAAIDASLPSREELLAGIEAEIDQAAERGRIRLTVRRPNFKGGSSLGVRWPIEICSPQFMPDSSGYYLHVASGRDLVAALHGDQLKKMAVAELDQFIEGTDLRLVPRSNREAALKAIDAEIDGLERIDAELCWAAVARGEVAPWRSDASPKAILGLA